MSKKLKADILKLVKLNDNVTVSELKDWLKAWKYEVDGDWELFLDKNRTLMLCNQLSLPLLRALEHLIGNWLIVLYPPTFFMEFSMGRVPRLPQAKWPPKVPYKEPHWLPAVLRRWCTPKVGQPSIKYAKCYVLVGRPDPKEA